MRIGHAERETVTAELREHYASGRLTLEELDERLDAALAARTRGDLDALLTDLPAAGPPSGPGTAARNNPGRNRGAGQNAGRSRNRWGDQGDWAGRNDWASRNDRASRNNWAGRNAGGRGAAGQAIAAMVWAALMVCILLSVGFLGAFGIGVGRPFGIVLILAGLAFLRRLLLGRRRRGWACGPRRRRW